MAASTYDYVIAAAQIALGLHSIFWSAPRFEETKRKGQKRLAELQTGAAEAFFEERRQLQAYQSPTAGFHRTFGVLFIFFGLGHLYFALTA